MAQAKVLAGAIACLVALAGVTVLLDGAIRDSFSLGELGDRSNLFTMLAGVGVVVAGVLIRPLRPEVSPWSVAGVLLAGLSSVSYGFTEYFVSIGAQHQTLSALGEMSFPLGLGCWLYGVAVDSRH